MIGKYPFVLTVYRAPGTSKPIMQQHSYEAMGPALAAQRGHFGDRSVLKVTLSVVLDEMNRSDFTVGYMVVRR